MSTALPIKDNKLNIKAVTYQNGFTPLVVKNLEIPVEAETIVKPTEVLVEIKATSLNPVDCIVKSLSKNWFGVKDRVIGGDFAGIVVKAGSETGYAEGDKIFGDLFNLKTRGSSSNYALFDINTCFACDKMPEGMSFKEAAALPCVSNTAFAAFKKYQGDLAGKNVLILGAGTSVGYAGVQYAKHYFKAGNVVATCSGKSTEKTINGGADVTIDYTKGDEFKKQEILSFVKAHDKFDLILDTVRDESVFEYFDEILTNEAIACQVDGSYVIDYKNISLYNFLPSSKKLMNMIKGSLGLTKHKVNIIWTTFDPEYAQALAKMYKEKTLKIVIDSAFDGFTEFDKAFDKVASCKSQGKVILTF